MKYTAKQLQGLQLLKDKLKQFYMFDGGARSGKTYLICRYIILRALLHPNTRHLAGRLRFNHAKLSLWMQTLLPMLDQIKEDDKRISEAKGEKPHIGWVPDNSNHIIKFANGSEIWLGGFDEKERADKIFGQGYATIWINEAHELSYSTHQNLKTRLNWKGMDLKYLTDTNPKHPAHWLHKTFINHVDFENGGKLAMSELYARLAFSPYDNQENLHPSYIKNNLETLTGVKRKRLLDGIWCESAEGSVYNFKRDINHIDDTLTYEGGLRTITGWDFGVMSDVFIVWMQVYSVPKTILNPKGLIINIIDEYVNNNKDYVHYANVVKGKPYRDVEHIGDPAGKSRDSKLESWFTNLRSEGIILEHPKKQSVADMIDTTNNVLSCIRVNETQCPHTVEMFENWTYPKDRDGKVVEGSLPEHNIYSHPGTALYYAICKLFDDAESGGVSIE